MVDYDKQAEQTVKHMATILERSARYLVLVASKHGVLFQRNEFEVQAGIVEANGSVAGWWVLPNSICDGLEVTIRPLPLDTPPLNPDNSG